MADIEKKVHVKIEGDSSDLDKALKNGAKSSDKLADNIEKDSKRSVKSLKNIETQAKSIGKAIAIVGTALTGFAIAGVRAFIEQDKVMKITEQTIKSTGNAAGLASEQIFKMASEFQKVTKFGDEAIIGAQNLLLTFKNIKADNFERTTAAVLDMSEAMGMDLKSSAIQLGKALNDPTTGLSMLTRVGITFTDQQKEQIKALQESGQAAKAQGVILAELESQFGGVARAAADGTGVYKQTANLLGDVLEVGGKVVNEFLQPATIEFRDFVQEMLDSGKAEQAIKGLAVVLEGALRGATLLTKGMTSLFGVIGQAENIGAERANQSQDKRRKEIEDKLAQGGLFKIMGSERRKLEFELSGLTPLEGGLPSPIEEPLLQSSPEDANQSFEGDLVDEDTGFKINEAGTVIDPNQTLTDEGIELLAEQEAKKQEALAKVREDAAAKEREESQKHNDFMQATLARRLFNELGIYKGSREQIADAESSFQDVMATISESGSKKLAAISKAYSIYNAVNSTWEAANKALAAYAPPFSFAAAAAAVAAGMSNVRNITKSSPNAGFSAGVGSFQATPPQDVRVDNADIARQTGSGYYENKVQVEFVGDAARVLQSIEREGQQLGVIA
jgi:hypothetical protein